jgi:hypothetical protein
MTQMLRCPQCKGEMTLTPLEPIEGEEHGVQLRIEAMPALQCANGHRRFAAPGFAAQLLDELLAGPPLVAAGAAQEKGFLRKRLCCPECGTVLDAQGRSSRLAADRSVGIEGMAPFDVHVELPSCRCSSCGHELVEPQDAMLNDLMKASAQAFRSAHIAPG